MKGEKTDGASVRGNCCAVMDMALDRSHERFGLAREQAFSLTGAPTRTVTIYRMRRGKKDEAHEKFRDSTYVVVAYCPFCGSKIGRLRGKG